MERGDILLISYILDPVGWIICFFTGCRWHHVAWVINDKEVIELKAKGKRKTPISKYKNKLLYKCKVIRLNLDKCKVEKALIKAEQAWFKYSYSSAILNFILIKLKIVKQLPRLSCSGFVAYYLASEASFYFDKDIDPTFITPKNIEESREVISV